MSFFINLKNNIISFISSFRNPQSINIYKKVGKITFPAFLELFLMALLNVVNMVMVSRLGVHAISSVGITNQPFFLLLAFSFAVNVGTTTLVSWSMGKNDKKQASFVAKQAILFNLFLGSIMAATGHFGARFFMPLMIDDPVIITYSTQFLELKSLGLIFQAATMSISASFRGAGLTKIPMFYNLAASIVHICLNFLLIYGNLGFPRLEITGAAISTIFAQFFAFILGLTIITFWKKSPIRIKLTGPWIPHIKTIKDITAIGIPAAGEQFVIQTGLLIYTRILSSLDTAAFAAHQIAININTMAFSVSQAFSISNTALVGRACGMNDYNLAENYTVHAMRLARISTAIVTLAFIIFSVQIIGIYTADPMVINFAIPVFYVMAINQYVQSAQMTISGALRGSGDTLYPLYASIVGIWGFRIILALFFVFVLNWGVVGGWLAFVLDQMGRSIVVRRRFKSGKWRQMKAKREEKMKARQQKLT